MIVHFCDRCGTEMSGPPLDTRFLALDNGPELRSKGVMHVDRRGLPSEIDGLPMTLVGRTAAILHICGPCGESLLNWLANP